MFSLLLTTVVLTALPEDAPVASPELGAPVLANAGGPETTYTLKTVAEPPPPKASRTSGGLGCWLPAAGTLTSALGGYLGCLARCRRRSCSDGTVAAGGLTGRAGGGAMVLTNATDGGGSVWVTWFGRRSVPARRSPSAKAARAG